MQIGRWFFDYCQWLSNFFFVYPVLVCLSVCPACASLSVSLSVSHAHTLCVSCCLFVPFSAHQPRLVVWRQSCSVSLETERESRLAPKRGKLTCSRERAGGDAFFSMKAGGDTVKRRKRSASITWVALILRSNSTIASIHRLTACRSLIPFLDHSIGTE